jgi:hypothetical protein
MRFLISSEKLVASIFLIIFVYWINLTILALIFLISLALILFFFRIRPPEFKGDDIFKDGIYYSPVNGKVGTISKDEKNYYITLIVPWWRSCGIYLPIKSEVQLVDHIVSKNGYRYHIDYQKEYSRSIVSFVNGDTKYKISFVKCLLGCWPTFYLKSGDRGQALAQIGHFLFGGAVIVEIPIDHNICVKKGEKAFAGESIVARLA